MDSKARVHEAEDEEKNEPDRPDGLGADEPHLLVLLPSEMSIQFNLIQFFISFHTGQYNFNCFSNYLYQ